MPADVNLHDLEPWLLEACDAVGVDRSRIDVGMALRVSREVAHRLARPMAPVSTFILGVALASNPDVDARDLAARLEATLPTASNTDAGEH